jgi:hypothetical protein
LWQQETKHLDTVATKGPNEPALDDRWMNTEPWWTDNWQKKTTVPGEKPVPIALCPPQILHTSTIRNQWILCWDMTWPRYNNTLCNIYIPLLLRNNKQNHIHFWECYDENAFNHFMVLVLYLIIYLYLCSCNYSLFFAVCFCVCVLFSVFESLLGSSVLVFIINMVMIIFSLTHIFSFFSPLAVWNGTQCQHCQYCFFLLRSRAGYKQVYSNIFCFACTANIYFARRKSSGNIYTSGFNKMWKRTKYI